MGANWLRVTSTFHTDVWDPVVDECECVERLDDGGESDADATGAVVDRCERECDGAGARAEDLPGGAGAVKNQSGSRSISAKISSPRGAHDASSRSSLPLWRAKRGVTCCANADLHRR